MEGERGQWRNARRQEETIKRRSLSREKREREKGGEEEGEKETSSD